jgi:hypothetical protein
MAKLDTGALLNLQTGFLKKGCLVLQLLFCQERKQGSGTVPRTSSRFKLAIKLNPACASDL